MTEPFKFVIATLESGEPAGTDSAIFEVPARWYVRAAGQPAAELAVGQLWWA